MFKSSCFVILGLRMVVCAVGFGKCSQFTDAEAKGK